MEDECEALEWEQLRVAGKPLLSGAAFGATPLLWVACRAQPNLVHIFCDTHLQEIWRFPADPIFLAIGSGEGEGAHRLLVITRDGCIWILPLSKTKSTATRPAKKQKVVKAAKVKGEIQRITPPVLANSTTAPSMLSQGWKELDVETYVSSAIEVKNVVAADALIGTVPGAKVAAFGPNNYVALGSPAGPPELLPINMRTASTPEYGISSSAFSREPACLLAVSSVRHGFADGQTVLSQDLLEFLSGPSGGGSDLLIQGNKDGKLCTFRMEKDTTLSPPHTVYDLHQPVVTIIPVAYSLTRSQMDEARGANWLIVIGVLGKVAFLSSVRDQITAEEPSDGPFLRRPVETTSMLRELSGPVSSACLLSGARLCYTVGSALFITELFHNLGSDGSLMKLPCQRIPVTNVAAVTGPGLFTYHGSHSLVALTGAGRLLSIKTTKQLAPGMDKTYSGSSVKVLLQSISDAESCRDAIQTHEQALTLAMNELALALPRARESATSKKNVANHKEESNEGLRCTLTAAPVPSTSAQLSFGFNPLKKPVDRNVHKTFKTRLDITLMNHSKTPLSQYWSCVLALQSCLSDAIPALHYSFTINSGHGLPVGFQWSHRIHVRLPGGPWGPAMATMYLCHLHDSHKALLPNGRASSAGCVVLLRQRIDLFSLLQGPHSTLGHTSWTPTNLKTKVPSLTGETGLLDLADAEMLGSFSGDLAFSFSADAEHTIRKPISNGGADWQHGFLNTFLQHSSTSTDLRRLRLTSQGGHTITISVDARRGQGGEHQSVVNIQSPCLLLGILLREAFLCRIMDLDAGNNKNTLVLHRSGSMVRVKEIQDLVERAREVLNVWKKFQGYPAPAAQDLVAPLLGHTYVVAREIIQAYKSLREEPSAALS